LDSVWWELENGDELFGWSVDVAPFHSTVAVGTKSLLGGVVGVYHFDGLEWGLLGSVIDGSNEGLSDAGHAVVISFRGDFTLLGAPLTNGTAGIARVFEWSVSKE